MLSPGESARIVEFSSTSFQRFQLLYLFRRQHCMDGIAQAQALSTKLLQAAMYPWAALRTVASSDEGLKKVIMVRFHAFPNVLADLLHLLLTARVEAREFADLLVAQLQLLKISGCGI